jgi:hypothetical protein
MTQQYVSTLLKMATTRPDALQAFVANVSRRRTSLSIDSVAATLIQRFQGLQLVPESSVL